MSIANGARRNWSVAYLLQFAGFLFLDHSDAASVRREKKNTGRKPEFGPLGLVILQVREHIAA